MNYASTRAYIIFNSQGIYSSSPLIGKVIANVQCGFTEGKGTTNGIFIMRNLIERSIEVKKDIFLYFIDYSEVFDKV